MIRSRFKMNVHGDAGSASTSVETTLRYFDFYLN